MVGNKYDFFLSRRGSVSTLAGEVANVLDEKGYRIFVQNYDMPFGQSLILPMHEAIKNSRDLIVLLTRDYEASPYTRKEFAAFQAEQLQSAEQRRIVVLRCDEVPPRGFLADCICQDLVGIDNPAERKRRIIDAIEGNSQAPRPPLHPFLGVPPRINGFTGRSDHLDQIDAILIRDVVAAVTQDSNPQGIGRAMARAFRDAGLSLQTIRECFGRAVDVVHDARPFSTRRFRTDGKTIFFEITDGVREGEAEQITAFLSSDNFLKQGMYTFRINLITVSEVVQ